MPINLALLVLLLNMSAFRGSKVLVSLFALELGAPQIMLGVIVALYSLCPMLLALYAGKMIDRFGVRWPLALGSLGMSLSLVLPGTLPSLHTLYLSALLLGLSHVFYNVSVQNLIGMLLGIFALPFMRSVPRGAATSVYVATSPDYGLRGGLYFSDCREQKPPHKLALDDEVCGALWQRSCELTGLTS